METLTVVLLWALFCLWHYGLPLLAVAALVGAFASLGTPASHRTRYTGGPRPPLYRHKRRV